MLDAEIRTITYVGKNYVVLFNICRSAFFAELIITSNSVKTTILFGFQDLTENNATDDHKLNNIKTEWNRGIRFPREGFFEIGYPFLVKKYYSKISLV